ncbi:MAG TPA: SURF1 family protein [Gemmatimonadaceae bacterium]|nr:SURF1 family protein [Gemmatimonadaceae bacterium]
MTRRNAVALFLGLLTAAVCIRLGFWQLHRLEQRRARNAVAEERMRGPAVPPAELPRDTAAALYRRVRLTGRWDWAHEIALTGRSRQGSPGVNLVTPLRPDDGGPAVLVNRGWVYSPDAATVDFARWREPEHATIEGYVVELPTAGSAGGAASSNPRHMRILDPARIAAVIPYPIAPYYVVAQGDGTRAAGGAPEGEATAPVRLPPPELGDGPHRSYAVQWFSFAAIAVLGVSALIWQDVRARRGGGTDA